MGRRRNGKKIYGFKTMKDELFNTDGINFPDFIRTVSKDDKPKMEFNGKVIMPVEAYQKMFMYVKNVNAEVSGMGIVKSVGNNIYIQDVFIVKQECSSGNTKIDNEDLSKKIMEIVSAGGDPSNMKVWWHSHASMGVFWSSTDDECCNAYATESYMVSLVVNHKRELKCRLDLFHPFRITLDNITVEVEERADDYLKLEEKCISELKEKVSKRSMLQTTSGDEDNKLVSNISEIKMDQFDNKKNAPKRNIVEFEPLYELYDPCTWQGLIVEDALGFEWIWDTTVFSYFPHYKKSGLLSKHEYSYVASLLKHGIQISKDEIEDLLN